MPHNSEPNDAISGGNIGATMAPSVRDLYRQYDELHEKLRKISPLYGIADEFDRKLYNPGTALRSKVEEFRNWLNEYPKARGKRKTELRELAGTLLEQLVLMAFASIGGEECIVSSYRSFAVQLDLLAEYNGLTAKDLQISLAVQAQPRILVEVKNTNETVNNTQFARLCFMLDHQFRETCSIGVMVARKSVSGFDVLGKRPKVALQDARATQMLFHARTGKFVIVLDVVDILKLDEPGYLLQAIRNKVLEVEKATGLEPDPNPTWETVPLPRHLSDALGALKVNSTEDFIS